MECDFSVCLFATKVTWAVFLCIMCTMCTVAGSNCITRYQVQVIFTTSQGSCASFVQWQVPIPSSGISFRSSSPDAMCTASMLYCAFIWWVALVGATLERSAFVKVQLVLPVLPPISCNVCSLASDGACAGTVLHLTGQPESKLVDEQIALTNNAISPLHQIWELQCVVWLFHPDVLSQLHHCIRWYQFWILFAVVPCF